MSKSFLVLSPVALALLAACATPEPVTPAPQATVVTPPPVVTAAPPSAPAGTVAVVPQPSTVVVQTPTLRTGMGRIEGVSELPGAASAGGSAGSTTRRLVVRMDDGSVQQLDTPADHVSVGDRVEIGSDGYLRRRAP